MNIRNLESTWVTLRDKYPIRNDLWEISYDIVDPAARWCGIYVTDYETVLKKYYKDNIENRHTVIFRLYDEGVLKDAWDRSFNIIDTKPKWYEGWIKLYITVEGYVMQHWIDMRV